MTDPLLSLLTPHPLIGMIHARLGTVLPSRVHLLLKINAPDSEPAKGRSAPQPGRGRGRPSVPDGARACNVCGWHKAPAEFPRARSTCKSCTNEAWNAWRRA